MNADRPENPSFAADFPQATREQWLKLVESALKGAPFEKKLVARTYDGLKIEPLYAGGEDIWPVAARAPGSAWQVMARLDHPDPAAANKDALHELENGATGLSLVFAGSLGACGYGLPAGADALARALEGVHLDAIAIELDLSAPTKDAASQLAELVKHKGLKPDRLSIRFGHDPISAHASIGSSPLDWPELAPRFAEHVFELAKAGFKGPHTVADGRLIHNAGGSEAQELAYVLAVAVAYLRALEAAGVKLDDARRMIGFRLAADADQFLTISKFRALRKLWARVEDACGLKPAPAFVSAETAWRMMTQRDPYVNMLRATIAVAAAGLGGANAIGVLPFTNAIGLPDRFARRVARNTQLMLLEESNLARVSDPAAGSGAIEDLTAQLCRTAWALFQDIEKAGGAWAALASGAIQKNVAAVRAAHERAVATRKDALTGASAFPNIHEMPIEVLDAAPVSVAADFPAVVKFDALPNIRLAAPFEALRDKSDQVLARTGARPKIFLANLGTPADFTARATFARNFFEAGGIEAVQFLPSPLAGEGGAAREASRAGRGVDAASKETPHPAASQPTSPARGEVTSAHREATTDIAALASAFKKSGAPLACLCSTDAVYENEAVAAAQALAAAGAGHLYLAGRPKDLEAELKKAGVQSFIYAGCDALATLDAAHDILAGKI